MLVKMEHRIGCSSGRLDVNELLNHKFMTTNWNCSKGFPRIKFRRGHEVDPVSSWTYPKPEIGFELIRDYCIEEKKMLWVEKKVVKIMSTKHLILSSCDENTVLRDVHVHDVLKIVVQGATGMKIVLRGGEVWNIELLHSLSKQWIDKLLPLL